MAIGVTLKRYAGPAILAAVAVAVPVTASFEGERLTPYPDVGGVLTICYGETLNVHSFDVETPAQCRSMLQSRLTDFATDISYLIRVPVTTEQLAAFTDFAYNVGVSAFARSALLRKLNAGDYKGACNELLKWRFAAGKEMAGLLRRRSTERDMCMKGVK